jgi:serine/threonine protein kinase
MQEQNHSLKNGTILNQYKIIKVLGSGGFGITYLAQDIQLGMEVVIKEYFPNEFAIRNTDSTIIAKTSSDRDFSKGMQRFKEEAQVLAKFNHPSIVKILGFFEANNTAYFVMEYEEGIDLSQYLKQINRSLSQEEILAIIMPILEGLKEVHKYKYLHRDIKPGNILLRKNRVPVLIDFGASKLAIGEASKSITSMLTEGYAPLEQYSTDIKQQGPFTDIYAVGAVIYKMITGKVPPSAQTRSYAILQDDNDPYDVLAKQKLQGYDKSFLQAIDKSLAIKAKDRPANIQEFQESLSGKIKIETENIVEKEKKEKSNQRVDANKSFNILSFQGNINRMEFLGSFVVYFVLLIFGSVLIPQGDVAAIFGFVFMILGLWIGLAAIVKRTRDMQDNIALVIIAMLIPYINFITLLLLLLKAGKDVPLPYTEIKTKIDYDEVVNTLKNDYTFLSKHIVRKKGTMDDFRVVLEDNNILLFNGSEHYKTYPIIEHIAMHKDSERRD